MISSLDCYRLIQGDLRNVFHCSWRSNLFVSITPLTSDNPFVAMVEASLWTKLKYRGGLEQQCTVTAGARIACHSWSHVSFLKLGWHEDGDGKTMDFRDRKTRIRGCLGDLSACGLAMWIILLVIIPNVKNINIIPNALIYSIENNEN